MASTYDMPRYVRAGEGGSGGTDPPRNGGDLHSFISGIQRSPYKIGSRPHHDDAAFLGAASSSSFTMSSARVGARASAPVVPTSRAAAGGDTIPHPGRRSDFPRSSDDDSSAPGPPRRSLPRGPTWYGPRPPHRCMPFRMCITRTPTIRLLLIQAAVPRPCPTALLLQNAFRPVDALQLHRCRGRGPLSTWSATSNISPYKSSHSRRRPRRAVPWPPHPHGRRDRRCCLQGRPISACRATSRYSRLRSRGRRRRLPKPLPS